MSARITQALRDGSLFLPETGKIRVYAPTDAIDLSEFPLDRTDIVQPFKPLYDRFARDGFECHAYDPGTSVAAALVVVPRSKPWARVLISTALQNSTGWIAVDGQKTDGIESIVNELRRSLDLSGTLSKAHGKLVWFDGSVKVDLQIPASFQVEGFATVPGVFSADGVDPGSRLLAEALPGLAGHVIDLGAGWGYLASRVLDGSDAVTRMDLVEADAQALDCAKQNLSDDRARFHWADATAWTSDEPADAVIMNPPFHTGRSSDPSLGQAFIKSAARNLKPNGRLWMVANRHLPYEAILSDMFKRVEDLGGTPGFKLIRAERPSRAAR